MRRLVPVLVLGAALPSTASAATFGELPFHPVAGGAKCLDAAGAPGELCATPARAQSSCARRPPG